MTEYSRGQGSEPWYPEDPYCGDGGWEGQQAHAGQQAPYGGQPQHYQQQPQQYGEWGTGQQDGYGQVQQQYDQNGYRVQGQQGYGDGSGWGTGTHTHIQYTDPSDPYGQQIAHYGERQPDYYGTPEAYPPPEPPSRRQTEPEPRTDWDPDLDQGEHAFFAGGGDDDDIDDEPGGRPGRGDRRSRGGKSKKRRSGCACLVVLLVFGGGIAGVGYIGYQLYRDRFGAAPDFAGDGTSETVPVSVPEGAGGAEIGRLLKAAGVVKSVDAFVSAFAQNKDSSKIQAGSYLLNKEMSATSAVELMLDPKSQNNLIVREGERNTAVYAAIDKRLELSKGTTAKVAKQKYKELGLPDWALGHPDLKDPLEGFLYPSAYAASKSERPETILKEMVSRASDTYEELGLEKKAEDLGLDGPWQLLTVASLVQAEGTSHEDFRKMAEVVYNRLKPGNPETYGALEFDSTYNYIKNQSKIDLTIAELRQYDNPYNTYFVKGLPPGPIDNPGEEALKGALNPTEDGWYYFISLDGKTSKFTKTLADHEKLRDQFNASRNND